MEFFMSETEAQDYIITIWDNFLADRIKNMGHVRTVYEGISKIICLFQLSSAYATIFPNLKKVLAQRVL